jgi:hypothetical protein
MTGSPGTLGWRSEHEASIRNKVFRSLGYNVEPYPMSMNEYDRTYPSSCCHLWIPVPLVGTFVFLPGTWNAEATLCCLPR